MNRSLLIIIGLVVFLAGGAVLAFIPGPMGTGVGTTAGIVGLALLGWAWLVRRDSNDE